MDTACTNAIEDYLHLGLPREAEALVLVDTDGDDLDTVLERATAAADIIVNGTGAAE